MPFPRSPVLALALSLVSGLFSAPAWAWPVDVVLEVRVGEPWLKKLSALQFVDVQEANVHDGTVQAEILPAGELLLTGIRPGATLVLLYAEGRMAVWRVRVLGKDAKESPVAQSPPDFAALSKRCKGLQAKKIDDGTGAVGLTAVVATEDCRQGLLKAFQTDAVLAKNTELTFEVPALQAQLRSLVLPDKVKARYLGAGLLLEGAVSAAEHRRVLWEVFSKAVGRVVLDDRLVVPPAEEGRINAPSR